MRPYVEFFEGCAADRQTFTPQWLGGKGFGLVEMAQDNLPVPPGFVIPTGVHKLYRKDPEVILAYLRKDVPKMLAKIEAHMGYMPLLSVRSGAPVSMPGMMDTVLNIGLTTKNFPQWSKRLGEDAAWDCRRRLVSMYATTVQGMTKDALEHLEQVAMKAAKVDQMRSLSPMRLSTFCTRVQTAVGVPVPDTAEEQVVGAIEAVFCSWFSERAIEYRKLHGISDDIGTACVIQAMVFGNRNEKSATGVLFTRCPSTGAPGVRGEFLVNAQGEDVVAGTHTPISFNENGKGAPAFHKPAAGAVAEEICDALQNVITLSKEIDKRRRDMQDVEFTVEDGKLWLLQTRSAKRSATAAFRLVRDMLDAGEIDLSEARSRVTSAQYYAARRPTLDRKETKAKCNYLGKGIPGSNGCVVGHIAFNATQVAALAAQGKPVILVRRETTPDDIGLMAKSVGILTATGGFTSHAAVVARGMDKVCVTGWDAMPQDPAAYAHQFAVLTFGGVSLVAGEQITLDGNTGEIWGGAGVVTGADDKETTALVRALAEEFGIVLAGEGGNYVSLAQAMESGVSLFVWKQKLQQRLMDGEELVIDLRSAEQLMPPEDREFLAATGVGTVRRAECKAAANELAKQLAAFQLPNATVILPEDFGNAYVAAKLKTVPICDTLSGVKEGATVMLGSRVREVLGSLSDDVIAMLRERGVTVLQEPVLVDEAAAQLLA